MAKVTFAHITKRFGDVLAIADLNLEIRDQEFMVLVGPSGCGKSTALRMIAGLEDITAGTIQIDGRTVNDVPPKDRDIAMVFQSYALYPHMSVRQNLEFGLRLRKMDRLEIARRVQDAAAILGLTEYLERKPRQLSGGQRQRVAVGRAIVRQPRVFLFDEPLSNLDANLRVQMRAEITGLQHRLKTTTLYVTHDQVEAMTMGHRIAVLNEGRLMQVGSPLELYERPDNLFVARFIGSPPMNVFTARLSASGDRLEASWVALPLPSEFSGATRDFRGQDVVVGIRPENLGDAVSGPSDLTATLRIRVEVVEPLGHEVVVHGYLGDEPASSADPIIAKLAPHHIPAIDDEIELQVDLRHLHLFAPDTGFRLC